MRVVWLIYFVFIYENRRMKPGDIVLRREGGGGRRTREGVKLIKIYWKQARKYQNVSLCISIMC
jgi:hypothetical protein